MTYGTDQTPVRDGAPAGQRPGAVAEHRRRRRPPLGTGPSQQGAPQAQPGAPLHGRVRKLSPPASPQRGQSRSSLARIRDGRRKSSSRRAAAAGGAKPAARTAAFHSQGNSRREDRQKGPRMFVGRWITAIGCANGNVEDGPPSTIQLATSNGHNHGHSHGGHIRRCASGSSGRGAGRRADAHCLLCR